MRRTVKFPLSSLSIFFALSAAWIFAQTPSTKEKKGPVIEFEETSYDNGLHLPKKSANFTHDYSFRNTGDQPLKILSIGTACVTKVVSSQDEILPGEKAFITVTSKPNTGHASSENFSRQIQVTTNDPSQPTIELKISATFAYSLKHDPQRVEFGQVPIGQTPERSILIESRTDSPFQIKELLFDEKIFDLLMTTSTLLTTKTGEMARVLPSSSTHNALSPMGRAEKKTTHLKPAFRIEIRLKPNVPPGPFFETFILKTDRPDIPNITIPISGEILRDLTVEPKEIFLGIIRTPKTIEKTIRLKTNDPNFQIKRVATNIPLLMTSILNQTEGCEVHFSLDPTSVKTEIDGKLMIVTNSTSTPIIKIPIRGLVKLPDDSKDSK